jgi:predicted DNA-binding transcriptional regulator AlpA
MPAAAKPHRQSKDSHRARELWNIHKVVDKTTLSKSQIYALMKAQLFPRPVLMGKRSVAWPSNEVLDYIDEYIASAPRGGMGRVAIPRTPWSRVRPASVIEPPT